MRQLYRKAKRAGAVLTAFAILLTLFPARASADSESVPAASVTFTFDDSGVTASDESASGYEVDGTFLTVTAPGIYAVTGSCSEGNVTVKKGVTGVTLILDNLTLSCSATAPLLCKKSAGVTLWLKGDSTLTDNENPDDENSEDETVADAFEGAAVKVKSGAAYQRRGNADGRRKRLQNGIKAGATSSITVSGGTLRIDACAAFVLDSSSYAPVCEKTTLTIVS